jgi:hypothetical protein
LVLHQTVYLLQYERLLNRPLIGALKRHGEIGVDVDALYCRTI